MRQKLKQLYWSLHEKAPRKEAIITNRQSTYPDLEDSFWSLYDQCKDFTMTSVERMYSLFKAVEYVTRAEIQGDFVECGVWRGGSSMLAALAFQYFGDTSRRLYLYDTYEGMTDPKEIDVDLNNQSARDLLSSNPLNSNDYDVRCYASREDVVRNITRTHYPESKILIVAGAVETTIPTTVTDVIAILRLDTDWYESTYHELVHLYPRLAKNGVLIIDDYGHWKGVRAATDKYLAETEINIYLHRIDYTGRIGIKTDS